MTWDSVIIFTWNYLYRNPIKNPQSLQHRNESFLPCSLVSCTGCYMKWMNHGWEWHWFNSFHVHFTSEFQCTSLNTCPEHSSIIRAFLKDRVGMVFPISIKAFQDHYYIRALWNICTISIHKQLDEAPVPGTALRACCKAAQCFRPWFRTRVWWWTLRGNNWFLGRSFWG